MKKLFLFLFLISCSSPNYNYNVKNEVLDFNKDLTFDEFSEFNQFLIEYSKNSNYPDINN